MNYEISVYVLFYVYISDDYYFISLFMILFSIESFDLSYINNQLSCFASQ